MKVEINKRGFTLIELLAVIVILAIIALIATPIITNIISDSKKSASERSADNYTDAVETKIANLYANPSTRVSDGIYYIMSNGNLCNVELTSGNCSAEDAKTIIIEMNGVKPTGGTIAIERGMVVSKLSTDSKKKTRIITNGYRTNYNNEGEFLATSLLPSGLEKGNDVYVNPQTGEICSDYNEEQSGTGINTGCMKWYVYKDNGDGTYQLILDHNTTAKVEWITASDYETANTDKTNCEYEACNDEGPITANKQLKEDTKLWNEILDARLITSEEIIGITGKNSFTGASSDLFYFDSNNSTKIANATTKSRYAWLYDYTFECVSNGCNIEDSSNYGYWTSALATDKVKYAWYVGRNGWLAGGGVSTNNLCGIRPVITF